MKAHPNSHNSEKASEHDNHEEDIAVYDLSSEEELIVQNVPADQLSHHKNTINLRAMFPVAHRSVYAASWRWIITFVAMTFLIGIGHSIAVGSPNELTPPPEPLMRLSAYEHYSYYLFWGLLLILALKIIYEELFHMTHYYGIEAEHFIITTGVLLKNRSSLHISLITDVFLKRSTVELTLLLYSIQVANPSPESPDVEEISSLSRHHAVALQDYLVNLVRVSRIGPEGIPTKYKHDSPAWLQANLSSI